MSSKSLKFWNPKTLPKNFIIYILAPKRAGKSSLILDIVLNDLENRFDFVVVLCGNPHSAKTYKKHLPAKYVHERYDNKILTEFYRETDILIKTDRKVPKTLWILDDCLRMRKTREQSRTGDDPMLHRAFTEHRHYNMSLILVSQNMACNTASWVRGSDALITAPASLHNGNDFLSICKDYTGDALNWQSTMVLLETFKKYEFLVVRYHPASRKKDEMLRYYKVNKTFVAYLRKS